MKKPSQNSHKLQVGDLVEIVWRDVQSLDRQTLENIRDLPELETTKSYGVIIKKMVTCVVIAHEIGDAQADGFHVEMLPFAIIERVTVHGKVKLDHVY